MRALASHRLPHALLFTGPAGLGKVRLAEGLARALLCQRKPTLEEAVCGRCKGCRLFASGGHPDFVRVQPQAAGKSIRIDQVRAMAELLGYTSRLGGYKIALLTPADALNLNAANALLKTLEEPSSESLLLMVTAHQGRLPPTLRSRCHTLLFTIPPQDQALVWLRAQRVTEHDPELLLSLAGGAPLNALDLASGDRLQRRRALFDSFRGVIAGTADPVKVAEMWVKSDIGENLGWLMSWHRDMIRLKMNASALQTLVNQDLEEALRRLATRLTDRVLFYRLDAVVKLQQLASTQVNDQLMLEAFFASCVNG